MLKDYKKPIKTNQNQTKTKTNQTKEELLYF